VEETAWLQDKLVFRSEQFATLSKMLERKYGYHFIMESDRVRELSFTGSFTTETIEQALQAMQMVHPFQYRIQNENIYIR
jgi:ferric-dicitrate binding protein FerR (iron transport regulator)